MDNRPAYDARPYPGKTAREQVEPFTPIHSQINSSRKRRNRGSGCGSRHLRLRRLY